MFKEPIRLGALIAAAILFVLFVDLVINNANSSQYITVAVMLVFAVLATRLDDITNLNFGATGLKAELENKLREAQATVAQLQRIAEVFAHVSVQQITLSNRWDGLSSEEKRSAIEKIKSELRAVNLPEERINAVLAVQRKYDNFDYYLWVSTTVPNEAMIEDVNCFTGFQAAFPSVTVHTVPTPGQVESYIQTHDALNGEIAERLGDWQHYLATGAHRRPEAWDNR